ncbi:MAG: 3-deoxy-7-phosphoheptulonate synthase [Treponema sp.]|jgi:3-deoxy-7-phosphoheptulonate synthase|nr:3-deoxy-7-phosphoheptulonate synthase [Treponema sp.]MBQ1971982.1 3-deoxy-7-phosphoheptulonate synthase [Treponema sp.]MBQ5631506.1 3-deoxy-7-phosphoheptulonate synthase [Treponema sp.]MEE1058283.1 3-deoxy-7-phosphoheptulonate synthase [Treponema sp.]
MVIVLKKDISIEEKHNLANFLGENNFKTNEVNGEEKTIIAAVGKLKIDPREVELQPGVESVIPISKPYKMASREFQPQNSVIEIPNNKKQIIRVGGQRIISIAGPCAVENREQMMSIAKEIANSGACMLRGGAYKPRTSPYSFQGLGEEGLILLKEAGDKYGLPVVTEVVASEYLQVMEDRGVDVYQVGARNMQNFELLKKLGKLNKPVILKRGLSATIEEWLMSAEYLLSSGTDKVILCERGIRTYEKATRNTLDLSAIPILRGLTHLPIIVDPSHAVGIRDKIPPMGLAAIASGADGIIVEVHNCPEKALSDGPQALLPQQFDKLMRDIEALAPVVGKSVIHIRNENNSVPTTVDATENKPNKIRCAFSGKQGAYAEQAIGRYFDSDAEALSVDSFRGVFQAVADGRAEYGMIPIENSLAGSIYDNYDNLSNFEDISIVGAIHLRIQHSLLGVKGATLDTIKRVYSHPQGHSQCVKLLSEHNDWEKIASSSTSTAAKFVADSKSVENAAIASSINSKYYDLEIIQEGIEDDPRDYTRFVVIAANHFIKENSYDSLVPNKASFMFCVKNETGALYNCLGVFQKKNLNLTRLESRPIAGQPWKYWFYADAEIPSSEQKSKEYIENILNELNGSAEQIRLLGVYSEANLSV